MAGSRITVPGSSWLELAQLLADADLGKEQVTDIITVPPTQGHPD